MTINIIPWRNQDLNKDPFLLSFIHSIDSFIYLKFKLNIYFPMLLFQDGQIFNQKSARGNKTF